MNDFINTLNDNLISAFSHTLHYLPSILWISIFFVFVVF